MKKIRKNKGITLIALTVTIIVLLILAGIVINSAIGNKGIFSNAEKSKKQADISEEKNILKTSVISAMEKDSTAKIVQVNLEETLNKNVGNDNVTVTFVEDSTYGQVYKVKFNKTGNTYTILDDGTILTEDEVKNNVQIKNLLQNSNIVLEIGEQKKLLFDTNETITIENVTCKISDENIAKVVDFNNSEINVEGISVGSTILEVTADITDKTKNVKESKTELCTVTVKSGLEEKVKIIKFDPDSYTIDLSYNDKLKVKPIINPENVPTQLTWSSSNPSIATVDKNGIVTGKKGGTVVITVTTDTGKSAQCTVIVKKSITSLAISPAKKNIKMEEIFQLNVTILPEDTTENVSWESSDSQVVTVDQNGLVTGISKGTATITVSNPDGKIRSSATISVNKTQYGWYVNNYVATKDKNIKWKVFYEDDENTYIIADTCVKVKDHLPIITSSGWGPWYSATWLEERADYSASLARATPTYSGLIKDINATANKWLNITMNKDYKNSGYTGYMMDTSKWTDYYKDGKYAEFAIGGPTIEMYLASWNSFDDQNLNSGDKHDKIYYGTNEYGYYIGESSTSQSTTAVASTSKDSLYYPEISDTEDYNGYWLASPSAEEGGNGMLYIGCLNTNNCNNDNFFGFRPVVCLKNTYQLEQIEGEEAYNIVEK